MTMPIKRAVLLLTMHCNHLGIVVGKNQRTFKLWHSGCMQILRVSWTGEWLKFSNKYNVIYLQGARKSCSTPELNKSDMFVLLDIYAKHLWMMIAWINKDFFTGNCFLSSSSAWLYICHSLPILHHEGLHEGINPWIVAPSANTYAVLRMEWFFGCPPMDWPLHITWIMGNHSRISWTIWEGQAGLCFGFMSGDSMIHSGHHPQSTSFQEHA